MQQLLTSANGTATTSTLVSTLGSSVSAKQGSVIDHRACQRTPCTAETARPQQESHSFLLPQRDEVVRRVWNCERDGKFVTMFFDIWRSEIEEHFAFCVYEADTLKPIIRPLHPIQPAVLHLLFETELVPHNASISFIVKTGKQVDRVIEIGGK